MKKCVNKFKVLLSVALLVAVASSLAAESRRDYPIIVGSTTVYPFAARVVDQLVETSEFKRPLMQTTGSGGGLMLFCIGTDVLDPDITLSSRRIKQSEFDSCQRNGIKEIVEVKIGYDGIAVASAEQAAPMGLSRKEIYLALAKEVPDPKGGKELIPNPYKTWRDINDTLPAQKIKVLGPARSSGTHYIFSRLAMEGGCRTIDWIRALKRDDSVRYKSICRTLREDGAYIEANESDDLTVQKLASDPGLLAILSFGTLYQNRDKISALDIEGIKPDFENVADDSYTISRPLYLYVKKAHVDAYPGIREFLAEFTSKKAWGEGGYLSKLGLVPMQERERRKFATAAKELSPLSM